MTTTPASTGRLRRQKRISRVSAILKWVLSGVLAALLLVWAGYVLAILVPSLSRFSPETGLDVAGAHRAFADIPILQRCALALVESVLFALLAGAAWELRLLFARFQRTDYFSAKTLGHVFLFGVWLISYAVMDILSDPILSVLATLDRPEGQRTLEVSLDGGEIFFAILGALMLVFGAVLREAANLDDENRRFV
ncbi:Protein of unknown function (DUF2975) [Roseibium hamelinense]|uniref:DUF2975 family protein n=1 Tax=Roseibium hamelinense TaxID=150831 RepID=A0A562THZ8_9HYPH|nr:DUF2975 domain-containing protein [Roseibium hamelinense]MTI42066.1 DUF2975 domain-containing protein [Roseibium hamelinense]TWI93319.1 Protein of unknown function (DUF2975) [Roseibium hamelinense]